MSGIDSEWDVFLQNQFDPFTKGLLEETQYSESNIANNKISNEIPLFLSIFYLKK